MSRRPALPIAPRGKIASTRSVLPAQWPRARLQSRRPPPPMAPPPMVPWPPARRSVRPHLQCLASATLPTLFKAPLPRPSPPSPARQTSPRRYSASRMLPRCPAVEPPAPPSQAPRRHPFQHRRTTPELNCALVALPKACRCWNTAVTATSLPNGVPPPSSLLHAPNLAEPPLVS